MTDLTSVAALKFWNIEMAISEAQILRKPRSAKDDQNYSLQSYLRRGVAMFTRCLVEMAISSTRGTRLHCARAAREVQFSNLRGAMHLPGVRPNMLQVTLINGNFRRWNVRNAPGRICCRPLHDVLAPGCRAVGHCSRGASDDDQRIKLNDAGLNF